MDSQRINYLYQLYLDRNMDPRELEEFKQIILDPEQEAALLNQMDEHWNLATGDGLRNLQQDKKDLIFNVVVAHPQPSARKLKLWPRIAIAAAIAVIIFGSGLIYYGVRHAFWQGQEFVYKNDIAPGKQGATLTLANGKKIKLSDAVNGELAKEAGVMISKSSNQQLVYELKGQHSDPGKINTLSTDRGETYQVHLPDGSVVWLNAASSLTYAAGLNIEGKRRVNLEGEAYFEIAKDKDHPFVVTSKGQEVEVLGTHFNVNAYADEPNISTTLLEGSVKVTAGNVHQVIRPGEQTVNHKGNISVVEAEMENTTDWKKGDFFLDRVNFKFAMRKIARWYNVEVVYAADVPDTLESGGWIARENNLSTVLKAIEKSGIAHFKIEGRTLYVFK